MSYLNTMIIVQGHFHEEKTNLGGENRAVFVLKVREGVYVKDGPTKYENRYWDFTVFGEKNIERVRGFVKGTPISITAKLDKLGTWQTKDGETRINVGLAVSDVSTLPRDFSESDPAEEKEDEEEDPFEDSGADIPAPPRRVPPPKSGAKVSY